MEKVKNIEKNSPYLLYFCDLDLTLPLETPENNVAKVSIVVRFTWSIAINLQSRSTSSCTTFKQALK